MKIIINNIPEGGLRRTFHVDEGLFEHLSGGEKPQGFLSHDNAIVNCEITQIKDRILVRGDVSATFVMECSRCLAPAKFTASDNFVYIFVPQPSQLAEELELSAEDMDVVFFSGEALDLAPVILEQINLLIPFMVLCGEDCSGICPKCGKSKKGGLCNCGPAQTENKFSQLKGLKLNAR
ncbi:MAG: DUF177 domain-containing protein [Deltaproteobacteria bacterium]|nr:DUF177 domain-containing protein [Deltaproteobacteria bacterium]